MTSLRTTSSGSTISSGGPRRRRGALVRCTALALLSIAPGALAGGAVADPTLAAVPASLALDPGTSRAIDLSGAVREDVEEIFFSASVTPALENGLAARIRAVPGPRRAPLAGRGARVLETVLVSAKASTPAGTYVVHVAMEVSGMRTATADVPVVVNPSATPVLTLSAPAASAAVQVGESAVVPLTVGVFGKQAGAPAPLSVTVVPADGGLTAAIDQASLDATGGTALLRISAGVPLSAAGSAPTRRQATPGAYTVTVSGGGAVAQVNVLATVHLAQLADLAGAYILRLGVQDTGDPALHEIADDAFRLVFSPPRDGAPSGVVSGYGSRLSPVVGNYSFDAATRSYRVNLTSSDTPPTFFVALTVWLGQGGSAFYAAGPATLAVTSNVWVSGTGLRE